MKPKNAGKAVVEVRATGNDPRVTSRAWMTLTVLEGIIAPSTTTAREWRHDAVKSYHKKRPDGG